MLSHLLITNQSTFKLYLLRSLSISQGNRLTSVRVGNAPQGIIKQAAGRPSLTGPIKISPEIKARVSQESKVRLEREAKRRGETPYGLIREALESHLTAEKIHFFVTVSEPGRT